MCVRTQNEDTVPQRLSSIRLHCNVQDGWVSCHNAHAVVLLRLPEHPQQLIGYDTIQGRNGDHGHHEGEKGVYLWKKKGEPKRVVKTL